MVSTRRYILLFLILLNIKSVIGAQMNKVSYQRQVNIKICANEVNRINFDNQQIVKIVGDLNNIKYELSRGNDNLYLTPRVGKGENISIIVELSNKEIIDLRCMVVDGAATIIRILGDDKKINKYNKDQYKEEAAWMIEAMQKGDVSKYYVEDVQINVKKNKSRQIIKHIRYRFDNLEGIAISLENLKKLIVSFNKGYVETELKELFDNVIASSSDEKRAYIVLRKK